MQAWKNLAGVALAAGCVASAHAGPVNLSTWAAEGPGGTWTVAPDQNSVFQSVNGDPTVFFSNTPSQGKALSGKIKVETTGDDDYIGFVLGFSSGALTRATNDYILIDWKQSDQAGFFGCTAQAGLAISRVTGTMTDGAPAWCHSGTTTELARGATLSDTGWQDNTEYTFDLIFTANNIQVKVNGVTELNVNGTFADGAFGFYNYSQASVRYSALEETIVTPPSGNDVPEPMSLALVLLGLGAAAGSRRRAA
jgi:hypothetical protein